MSNHKHSFAGRFFRKILSVTLASTMLFSMGAVGNIFGITAYAAEEQTDGDYTYVVLDDGTARITKYSGTEAELTIPATFGDAAVSEIGSSAFSNNEEIESVTFPEGLKTIGEFAFADCDLLETVNFSNSVTDINRNAFEKCRALQSVEIPETVKTLGDRVFSECPILTDLKLNEGLESIGNRVIAGTAVSTIYIPTTVTKATESFADNELLDAVTFGEGITAIPDDMFENCKSIRRLTIPATVTRLGRDCMALMTSLESIVIPDSVTEMGEYVFYECGALKSVVIGTGVTVIPSNTFFRCVSLKDIVIPSNVTVIGDSAFRFCSKLENVTLSEGLENIGNHSFEGTALKEITIPSTVSSGNWPFSGCGSLKTITLTDANNTLVEGLCANTGVENVNIPGDATQIAMNMFSDCKKLAQIEFPSTLKTIKRYAFSNCEALNNIDLPKSVKTIEDHAFVNTTSLTKFTLREGVQTLGGYIFEGSALTSIYIPKTLSSTPSPFANSNISSVTFSDGIATLNDELFRGDHKLTEIEIPETVIKIGSGTFRETNLEAVVIPDSVKTIGSSVFEDCRNLYAVKFGEGIRKIPQYCFYQCVVLQNVIIPETVVEMDGNVFERSGLTSVTLPQSLHYIPNQSFKDCAKLVEVTCSDELERIGDYAFERCYNFTTLNTPVQDIEFNNSTFSECPKLTDKRFYVFDPSNTGIESTENLGTNHTLVHFTVKYAVRKDWDESDLTMKRLYLNYPDNLEVINNSFSAEGFTFDADSYTGDFRSFSLADAKTSGELRFSAYLNSSNEAFKNISAELEFEHKGTYFRKPLGEVKFTTAKLSLFAPSFVTNGTITVSGYSAAADKDVTVFISKLNKDGGREDTVSYNVTPNKYTGKYISDPLKIAAEGKSIADQDKFEVYSECNGSKSETTVFTYSPRALKVAKATETVNITKFISPHITNLSHGGQNNTYDITGIFTRGTSPVISINPAEMLKFEFDLENDENVSHVVLMSHKGSEWKFMELYYDAETDLWIGEGYFEKFDREIIPGYSYVPGQLNLFYVRGERKDTYKAAYYGETNAKPSEEPVGKEVFYYDGNGQPHGTPGNYHETARDTVINVIVDGIQGDWGGALSDAVTGGLHTLWDWGTTNDNGFAFLHGGVRLGPDGLPILPGDGVDMYNRDPKNDGKQRNAIDPSGTVYEAVKGNPVEGATATIYKLNEDNGEWEEWNAADYEQLNPLSTNNEGAYAWMTDEGRFKVTVSKEGYETQTSEEFDIPPEKLGLDFSLVDNTTHPAATVEKGGKNNTFIIKFSKFMKPETVNAESVTIEGLSNVTFEPEYLSEGDKYADTFTVSGTPAQKEIKFTVTDAAQSYSGVSAEPSETAIEVEMPEGILGDADGDGKVSIDDATAIQKYLAGFDMPETFSLTLADLDGNGLTIDDATNIQKYLAQYEVPYPIGEAA